MNVPVSAMHPREYARIFGSDPFAIRTDELIVDIGSGYSDLTSLVPEGYVIQIDPAYGRLAKDELFAEDASFARVPMALGDDNPAAKKVINEISKLVPDRVTIANALRYIPHEDRTTALQTCLSLARDSIFQIYPFQSSDAEAVARDAVALGYEVSVHRPNIRRLRQALFTVATINNTITIEQQHPRVKPAARKRMAQLLTEHTALLGKG